MYKLEDAFPPTHDMWVWQSPSVERMKLFRVLYEIITESRRVMCWHISMTDLPDYGVL
jgi:hypothetical protein